MDLEPGTMDSVRSGPFGQIFRPDNFVFGKYYFFLKSEKKKLYYKYAPESNGLVGTSDLEQNYPALALNKI